MRLLIFLIIIPAQVVLGQANNLQEEAAVLKTVELFFNSMAAHDTATARQVLTSDGQYYALRNDSDSIFQRMSSNKAYLENLSQQTDVVKERMWDPTVLIHQQIAMVWAPYDIHVNGKFLHCGVDCFSLVKSSEGWKIASVIFTMEPQGCAPSPLGPPK